MSFRTCRTILTLAGIVTLAACTQVDDYMFGTDNTVQPAQLTSIKAKMSLVQKWSVSTGKSGKANSYLKLDPVLVGGVIYTASVGGTVQATDDAHGKVLWSVELHHHLVSGPSVARNHIAVATNASTLLVLERTNGKVLWKANLSSDALAKPVIADMQVFVKTIDGNLYAFDLSTGEKLWVVDHGSPNLILKASSAPVIMDKLVLVGFSDGKLDAIERKTGRVVWQRNIAYANGASDVERLIDIDADPVVRGDQIYLASYQGYIGALSMSNGEFTWRNPASIYKNFVIHGDNLYYVDSESVVWALNRITGQVKWKQEALKARNLTDPVLMGNRLLVGDRSGLLHGLSANNGELVSRTQLSSPTFAAPVVSGSSVYVLTTNGQLSRFVL